MPAPTSSLSTLRPDLGGSLEEFDLAADRQGFVGQKLLPVFETEVQAANCGKIPLKELLKNRETARSPGGGYNRGRGKFSPWSFATEEHGFEEVVDDRQSRMYKNYLDAELVATQRARDVVLRNQEKRYAALLHDTATFTGDKTLAITHEWDDATNAVPIDDVDYGKKQVWEATGLWPDTLQINRWQFMKLRNCASIIDRLKYQGFHDVIPERVTTAMLAQVFDLRQVLVAGSAKNTANEGQDAVIASIWSDEYAFLCRAATGQDPREPCLGRTFHWSDDGSMIGGTVETYREENVRGEVVRVRHDVCEKIMYTACGFLFSNVITI